MPFTVALHDRDGATLALIDRYLALEMREHWRGTDGGGKLTLAVLEQPLLEAIAAGGVHVRVTYSVGGNASRTVYGPVTELAADDAHGRTTLQLAGIVSEVIALGFGDGLARNVTRASAADLRVAHGLTERVYDRRQFDDGVEWAPRQLASLEEPAVTIEPRMGGPIRAPVTTLTFGDAWHAVAARIVATDGADSVPPSIPAGTPANIWIEDMLERELINPAIAYRVQPGYAVDRRDVADASLVLLTTALRWTRLGDAIREAAAFGAEGLTYTLAADRTIHLAVAAVRDRTGEAALRYADTLDPWAVLPGDLLPAAPRGAGVGALAIAMATPRLCLGRTIRIRPARAPLVELQVGSEPPTLSGVIRSAISGAMTPGLS